MPLVAARVNSRLAAEVRRVLPDRTKRIALQVISLPFISLVDLLILLTFAR